MFRNRKIKINFLNFCAKIYHDNEIATIDYEKRK
jgi:hypothetical protein